MNQGLSKKGGMFFALEGGEGSGKTRTIQYLKEHLPSDKFIFTREPGGTSKAERIRDIFISKGHDEPLDVLTELLLVNAARRQHIVQLIRPALSAGMHVVCDRFDTSTYAYQIGARGKDNLFGIFSRLHTEVCGVTTPHFTVFLDVPPEVGIARAHKRAYEGGEDLSRFDKELLPFHEKVRESMKQYLRMFYSTKYAEVDATREFNLVAETVMRIICSRTDIAAVA